MGCNITTISNPNSMAKIIKTLDSNNPTTPFETIINFNITGQGSGSTTLIPEFKGVSADSEEDATQKALAAFEAEVGTDVDWIRANV